MSKIKIISDPYKNENESNVEYQIYSETSGKWEDAVSGTSELLNEKYRKGVVFPFIAKETVDILIEEFRAGQQLVEIVFEGTDDEYEQMQAVCNMAEYQGVISLSRSERRLENASSILPEVKSIFNQMMPLIKENVKNNSEMEDRIDRFNDVSKSTIPLCIIGNYSAGKSTFINALIGNEILPSADESLTAKIHCIKRTKNNSPKSRVKFSYGSKDVQIELIGNHYTLSYDRSKGGLPQEIEDRLKEMTDADITKKVNMILSLLNRTKDELISDEIDIEIPFSSVGPLGESENDYVIFDTPGANSATNIKHLDVLKSKMQGLSNGLLIYLSKKDDLDSNDNEKLCRDLMEMKELDTRFTLIVVNRADDANLPRIEKFGKDDIDEMLHQYIPRMLYAEGLFFVSSIIALGAKTGGDFINEHYERIYHQSNRDFEDSGSKWYTQLYKYDIMPAQIKESAVRYSEELQNVMLANSGLYCVEHEIETFAKTYSPYNKCSQSKKYLEQVVRITHQTIEEKKRRCEESKKQRTESLDKSRKLLVDEIETRKDEFYTLFEKTYNKNLELTISVVNDIVTEEEIKRIETRTRYDFEDRIAAEEKQKAAEETAKKIMTEVPQPEPTEETSKTNLENIGNEIKKATKTIVVKVRTKVQTTQENIRKQNELNEAVLTNITLAMKERFIEKIMYAQAALNDSSREFWLTKTDEIKEKLSAIVKGSVALPSEKRKAITDIIKEYDIIYFDNESNEIFDKSKFDVWGFRLENSIHFQKHLTNKYKLADTYNKEFTKRLKEVKDKVYAKHFECFRKWYISLIELIIDNITELSSELRATVELIKDDEKKMIELETLELQLQNYIDQLNKLMAWKTE